MITTFSWITIAYQYLGMAEIPGKSTAPFISKMLTKLKAWWTDDETPWCGVFAGYCLTEACFTPPKAYYRAKEYLNWGIQLNRPAIGCIVVFTRDGGGHVGFVVGKDSKGRLMVLGGNQGNKVSIAPFDMSRVAGYRFPSGMDQSTLVYDLPILASNAASSSHEA